MISELLERLKTSYICRESLGVFFCFVMWENRMEHVSKTFCNLRSKLYYEVQKANEDLQGCW